MRRFIWSIILVLSIHLASFAELRGVWLTTNLGLDWPGNVFDEQGQKRKMTDMLDRLQKAHFNLILFQVQANGDVAWNSNLQPAMSSITGNAEKTLSYDVCRFVIDECHRRGMKCHAWIVPYRLGSLKNANSYAGNKVQHIVKKHAKWCIRYNGSYYIDPSNPEAREYLVKLYKEMVARYDFDGINLDYTRYPGNDFPDDKSYKKYARKKQPKADWRRENINRFVADLYNSLKKERPGIVIGSAPIGTYRKTGNTKNSTAYDNFQQDPVQWVTSGHHDMIVPQMYWDEKFGFSTHLSTWASYCGNASLVIGLSPYKMLDGGWTAETVTDLMSKARKTPGVSGVCFFRAEHILGTNPKVKKLYEHLVNTPIDDEPEIDDCESLMLGNFME